MRALDCEEQVEGHGAAGHGSADEKAVVPSQTPSERRFEPLSDEWFEDLDKSIDEITRLFEEMRMAPPDPEDVDDIQDAEDGLAAIEQDLTNCFTSLESLKRRLGSGRSPKSSSASGDDLFKQFRPRSLDLSPFNRIRKTRNRVCQRKSMPSIRSPLGEAFMKHLFG